VPPTDPVSFFLAEVRCRRLRGGRYTGGPTITRRVVQNSQTSQLTVEVYPMVLKARRSTEPVARDFSISASVSGPLRPLRRSDRHNNRGLQACCCQRRPVHRLRRRRRKPPVLVQHRRPPPRFTSESCRQRRKDNPHPTTPTHTKRSGVEPVIELYAALHPSLERLRCSCGEKMHGIAISMSPAPSPGAGASERAEDEAVRAVRFEGAGHAAVGLLQG
jgi:hypothetical protein